MPQARLPATTMQAPRRRLRLLIAAALLAGSVHPGAIWAKDADAEPVREASVAPGMEPQPPAPSVTTSIALIAQRARTEAELKRIGDAITLSKETATRLDAEIARYAADRDELRTAMISAATEQRKASVAIAGSEARIGSLADQETRIKSSLRERRGVLAEVLGALERMGRKPPPALLVKPGDALGSVRSAILLGAVVPEIRTQTEALLADLTRLVAVKDQLAGEKQRFAEALTRGREEEERLRLLFAQKEKLEAEGRGRIGDENRRAAELASQATTLQELIASLEAETARTRAAEERERLATIRAAEEARQRAAAEAELAAKTSPPDAAAEPRSASPEPQVPATAEPPTYDVAQLRREMARMAPAAAFSTLKGSLVPPVAGRQTVRFGHSDGIGRAASGVTIAARAGDTVTAPAEGQILYSGPFRSYGQLLILNAGDGYHIVLAGMSRIDVSVGQFVLSGEPLAAMGATRIASASDADMVDAAPSLYVEFRKDGKPVDPQPWWTDGSSGRTRNDT
ncbi:murein hydrolase activator EnvC [Aureimonas sp. AU12]|uniref:murein hydrolase activator EnvC family protein n=1 Tax=Aureimonas sp. AU12 TaxID=1638161 RepID=UPI000ACC7E17|nr:peptidoglycan DD-metalloendopeptidase family protein [Aureimonas sp. AU12]